MEQAAAPTPPEAAGALVRAREAFRANRFQEAEGLCRELLALGEPVHPEVLHMLGLLLAMRGRAEEGLDHLRRAVELAPGVAAFAGNLGLAMRLCGRRAEAMEALERTLVLDPRHAGAHLNLANLRMEGGDLAGAEVHFREAVRLEPGNPDTHHGLGTLLQRNGRLSEAEASFHRALAASPRRPHEGALNNLATVLLALGRAREAVACLARGLSALPPAPRLHSNYVYSLHLLPEVDVPSLLREHRRWDALHGAPLGRQAPPHGNVREPERPLRVAYLSPRFCRLPEGRFLLPLLREHDRTRFLVHCYSDTPDPDGLTEELRRHAHVWRDVRSLSDEALAALMREDGVDIAVDLMLHGSGNRMLTFARRPAPVQVSWMAYASTTGLAAMDHRLSDRFFDPPGTDEAYVERTWRLPETYWCYEPVADVEPGPLPALRNGRVTLGCLVEFSRVSPPVLEAWARILAALPGAELLLRVPADARAGVQAFLGERGVDVRRLRFADMRPLEAYFTYYQEFDLALDPFPRAGATTTLDALWMGVPVVTFAGPTGVSRSSASILGTAGLDELVTRSPEAYVQAAVALAQDLPRLEAYRAGLRDRLKASPLCDARALARGIEEAYRAMWRGWCEG